MITLTYIWRNCDCCEILECIFFTEKRTAKDTTIFVQYYLIAIFCDYKRGKFLYKIKYIPSYFYYVLIFQVAPIRNKHREKIEPTFINTIISKKIMIDSYSIPKKIYREKFCTELLVLKMYEAKSIGTNVGTYRHKFHLYLKSCT